MSDGQTFIGTRSDSIISFKGIPFAEPPVGLLRWKQPRLLTAYTESIDARKQKLSCATMETTGIISF